MFFMGTRDYKNFAPGCYYHIYNRGVDKMAIFKDEQDFNVFFNRLKENLFPNKKVSKLKNKVYRGKSHTPYIRKMLPPGSFSLITYCLMPNHFHILIKQNSDVSVSRLILKVCSSYSKYFNLKYNRVGSLFQDQFKSVLIDSNEYLLWLSAYIHLNPRIANLIKKDISWRWSSYVEYLSINSEKICKNKIILDQLKDPSSYKKMVEDSFENIQQKKHSELELEYAEFESP